MHMTQKNVSRKNFLRNTLLGVSGALCIPHFLQGSTLLNNTNLNNTKMNKQNSITLKNVRLETGFIYENNEVIGTKTSLFTIKIKDGKITEISKDQVQGEAIDAKGLLLLPSFKDMHIHLDKTLYTEEWRAVRQKNSVKDMIALEQQVLPDMLKNSTEKAERLIELLQSNGTSFARSHVNIEPTSKLDSLKNLEIALSNKKNSFGTELVAFPQHGLFYTDSLPYMKEAAQMDVDFIGGLDPTNVDGSIERTMDSTLQLALDYNKGIDIHLHEAGESGIKTFEYLINQVNENPTLKGKTFISHAFALGRLNNKEQEVMAEKLANAQIGIISSIPIGKLIMPIPTLLKHGVNVMVGNDSIIDYWDSMGTGSVLQKANLAAQLYGQVSEYGLSRMLQLATAGPTPLNNNGTQEWPKVGDAANLVLVDASCSAEAVARISPVKSLIFEGNIVY